MLNHTEEEAINSLAKLYNSQYVSAVDLKDFISQYNINVPTKKDIRKQIIKLSLQFKFNQLKNYHKTTIKLYTYLNQRNKLNQQFIKKQQQKPFLVEGNQLDQQQIATVVACEDAELILAPAGSGKTASLLAKLNYLTDVLQIPADQILVIAFTNKVVAELKDRVKQTTVEIRTFHSLGNKIVRAKLPNHHLISDHETKRLFHTIIQNLRITNNQYQKLYDNYLHNNDIADETSIFLNLITYSHHNKKQNESALEELFISILGLQKSERIDFQELETRINQINNLPTRQKAKDFYQLYQPVATNYINHLKTHKLYDFADMLNYATDIVESMPSSSLNYQYILVDEAQDLSTSKYLLLKAILLKCKKVKLFAVGDDWQSIYRFAGSNLTVLDNFEKIFGRTTYRGLIEYTYRFGQPTAKISNKFIQKNPHQSKKQVKPRISRQTPIVIKLNLRKQPREIPQDYETVNKIIQKLYQDHGSKLFDKKLQIISRYNRDIYRLVKETTRSYKNAKLAQLQESSIELEWKIYDHKKRRYQKLKIPFCSMHKAKGITRDIIIVINANSGSHGIPATRSSDPIAEVLLTKLDDYPHAEERRLWYVAITRAKEKTFIISDASRISPFVFEISPKLIGAGVKVCPKCHRGIMLEHHRKKDNKIYYSCSNFTGGCRHVEV